MPRPKAKPGAVRSKMAFVRLRADEEAGLKKLAADLGQPPSRIIRRLIREALTGGPDYFDDGVLDLRRLHRELAAIGRNLNQLSRVANQGGAVGGEDVRRVINAGIVQMEAVKELYRQAVRAAAKRAVFPLYEAAGVSGAQGRKDQGSHLCKKIK
ncbi:MAG: plasmid mobilization relaxosome protein MobC [Chloroflexi bacterium]|nr:plasmid mobilization relaxosome protein MobC [Chloroflexota bacterium]